MAVQGLPRRTAFAGYTYTSDQRPACVADAEPTMAGESPDPYDRRLIDLWASSIDQESVALDWFWFSGLFWIAGPHFWPLPYSCFLRDPPAPYPPRVPLVSANTLPSSSQIHTRRGIPCCMCPRAQKLISPFLIPPLRPQSVHLAPSAPSEGRGE